MTYRYLLRKAEIYVEGAQVDPVFLTKGARHFLEEDKGGAKMQRDWNIPVKYARDENGTLALTKVEDASELNLDDHNLEAAGAIYIRVPRFPCGFAEFDQSRLRTALRCCEGGARANATGAVLRDFILRNFPESTRVTELGLSVPLQSFACVGADFQRITAPFLLGTGALADGCVRPPHCPSGWVAADAVRAALND